MGAYYTELYQLIASGNFAALWVLFGDYIIKALHTNQSTIDL